MFPTMSTTILILKIMAGEVLALLPAPLARVDMGPRVGSPRYNKLTSTYQKRSGTED